METTRAKFLIGERVYLRPVEKEDLNLLYVWVNDREIRGLTGEVFPTSQESIEEFHARLRTYSSRIWLWIVFKEDDRLIGEAGLLRMFPAWRTADLSLIIGERAAWRKGYGTEAMELLLDYAFGYLNFHQSSHYWAFGSGAWPRLVWTNLPIKASSTF